MQHVMGWKGWPNRGGRSASGFKKPCKDGLHIVAGKLGAEGKADGRYDPNSLITLSRFLCLRDPVSRIVARVC